MTKIRSRRPQPTRAKPRPVPPSSRTPLWIIGAVAVGVLILLGLYLIYRDGIPEEASSTDGSGYAHVVGEPGIGETAPGFTLASTVGGELSLSDYRGKSVLLYFQEGLTCQPCWDQITDLEQNDSALRAAGVDAVVSITTDPIDLITQKVTDDGLATPVLSDPDLAVSKAYDANKYGMMGESRDGHSFILVGPDGIIEWRADYGGPPDYTMFLPTEAMLADLAAERAP